MVSQYFSCNFSESVEVLRLHFRPNSGGLIFKRAKNSRNIFDFEFLGAENFSQMNTVRKKYNRTHIQITKGLKKKSSLKNYLFSYFSFKAANKKLFILAVVGDTNLLSLPWFWTPAITMWLVFALSFLTFLYISSLRV